MANPTRWFAALLWTVLAACPAGGALAPEEVLVVANRDNPDSVALAQYYLAKRGIPAANLVQVPTLRIDVVAATRRHFEQGIREPIRRALARPGGEKIRCICLLYGVPYRVLAPEDDPAAKAAAALARQAADIQRRLAVDLKFAETVARDFPAPRTKQLHPVEALFAAPAPQPAKSLPAVGQLTADLRRALSRKAARLGEVSDPARRAIASRQLQALHLDAFGLRGLVAFLRTARPPAAPDVAALQKQLDEATTKLARLQKAPPAAGQLPAGIELVRKADGLAGAASYVTRLQARLRKISPVVTQEAAVDSELALALRGDYSLSGPAPNPLYWRARGTSGGRALMVARIDAPSKADAMRMIKASVETEARGLEGVFYIDAGGPARVPAAARNFFDGRLRALHRFLAANTTLKVVLDSRPTLFAPDSCPRAALYVGWYSLRKYVPAFMWTPGAVGYHVASWEAVHLRDATSSEWCPKMIQHGVAATLGAVREPLLTHFPDPEHFFALLLTGRYTIAECYWRTVPSASWQMILLADPLYNPFRKRPAVKPAALPAGLAP